MSGNSERVAGEMVTLVVDGIAVTVPQGTNLIEAAKLAGIEIPYYCYHPHLSVAGNCRMCQVKVEGTPKLTIACNTGATNGMVVATQKSSAEVAEAQRATLEFLLINHPLDCTVCDQAGHCKLQDYYYEYNGKASRYFENKVHKIKAEVLGPEVVYDGERCIVCTRCVRFCDEVTKSGELGVFNRGDKTLIGIEPGKELTNPLSGTVVDLCPVGALTHRRWRFNTRMWYTKEISSICPGCSTGCNVKVAERDGQIVQIKARLNSAVNKEWLCDEGRYGFGRFQPRAEERLASPVLRLQDGVKQISWEQALEWSSRLKGTVGASDGAVLLSPHLTVEEIYTALQFASEVMGIKPESGMIAMQCRRRKLDPISSVLVSPDFAPNARGAILFGLGSATDNFREVLEQGYERVLQTVSQGGIKRLLLIGDASLLEDDILSALARELSLIETSVFLGTRSHHSQLLLPARTVNEKSGLMINGDGRIQRLQVVLQPPLGALPEWMILKRIAQAVGKEILVREVDNDRALFRFVVSKCPALNGLTLGAIGEEGVLWGSGLGAAQSQEREDQITV